MLTQERTINVDTSLYRRADRKLRRYGHSMNEAVASLLQAMLSTRGDPLDGIDLKFDSADNAIDYLHDYVRRHP